MQIHFTPTRHDQCLTLERQGDTLTLNGESFDFSGIPDGATLPQEAVACHWLASDVERISGELHLTLLLPHGLNAPAETLFPAPRHLDQDGPVDLPPHSATPEDHA